ncbi:MAG: hypothetical protein ACO1N0_03640 [Fluviicola sp.]
MKSIGLIFFLFPVFSILHAQQELIDLKGEVDFPWINGYSAYGLDKERAQKEIAIFERSYKKAKRNKELSSELRLYELVKEKQLLYSPYVSVITEQKKIIVIYMDSATYAKTMIWNYKYEDLVIKQQFLQFESKGYWLGENAYLLTEFKQLTVIEDSSRRIANSKFAMDVYRQ